VRILAHRGAPGPGSTENTVTAISTSFADGADGVEVDLRLTADGVLAACHDPDLLRIAGCPLEVATSTWEALHAAACEVRAPIARVEWLLAAAGGRPMVLELKASPAPPSRTAAALLDRLLVLHSAGLPMELTVSSFDPALLAAVRAAAPRHLPIRTALLGRPGCLPLAVVRQALAAGHEQVHPHITDLLQDPGTVAAAGSVGIAIVPWTVNSRRAIRRCGELGVAALITDRPRTARLALDLRPAAP
jgi:glycerophosphoryl diester phosphodiesterase